MYRIKEQNVDYIPKIPVQPISDAIAKYLLR